MTLTIDTDRKAILFSGCNMEEAVHFARLHEFEGYTLKKDLPEYRIDEVVQVQHTNTLRFPNGVESQITFCDESQLPEFLRTDDKVIIASGQMEVKRVKNQSPTVSHIDAHLYTEIDGFGYYFNKPLTSLVILPNPESDAPKIDLSKSKKYTLEVGEVDEDVLVRGLSKEDIEAGWYLHRRGSDLKVVLMKSDE